MTVLPIVLAPDIRLKTRSSEVGEIDASICKLMDDMIDTMYAAKGIGLSAVQVGVLKRVIVVDVDYRDDEDGTQRPTRMVNPVIVSQDAEPSVYLEGCLSFPGQYSEVERPKRVVVEYLDEKGGKQRVEADGLLATCLQHEIDHMDGIVFIDHVSRTKRDIILRKMRKIRKEGDLPAYPIEIAD